MYQFPDLKKLAPWGGKSLALILERERIIIKVEPKGHSGAHQWGFTRYARITLDCGHSQNVQYLMAGDSTENFTATDDDIPIVGSGWHHGCIHCGKENLHPAIPGISNHKSWNSYTRIQYATGFLSSLGMPNIYEASAKDPELNILFSRLCGGDGKGVYSKEAMQDFSR